MDPYVEMKIELDVNSAGMLRYRVTLDLGYGEGNPRGEGYSIDDAAREAVKKAVEAATS